jgi:pimeloyl-ACP methyl ester carboxylesterase
MILRRHLLIIFITLSLLILNACGGSDSGSTSGPTPSAFTLECDLNTAYTAVAPPLTSTGTGTPTTTVIALHGKNGSPAAAHMTNLATDLNAQGFNVIMPYMPWSGFDWNGTLCQGISYINSLIVAENNAGNSVILLGHSLGGSIVLNYAALFDTTKPDAVAILAPGHFIHSSSVLASAHASSIQLAENMIAAGQGDVIATFQTSNGGVLYDISTTPTIYLSFHDTTEFPDIKAAITQVSEPTLWLAGLSDPLTDTAKRMQIINTIPAGANFTYSEITGDHISMVGNAPAEITPWHQGL